MISFEPSEELSLLQGVVADFAKAALAPNSRSVEAAGEVTPEIRAAVQELEMTLAAVPAELGGQGLGLGAAVAINEELAKGDAAAVFGLPGYGPFLNAAVELGSPEQARALIEPWTHASGADVFGALAWSEPTANRERAGFSTLAEKEGDSWVIRGTKAFVGNANRAETAIVFAQLDEAAGWDGIGAFVVPLSADGVKVGERDRTLGVWAADFATVELDRVRVPDSARLLGGKDFVAATLRMFAKYALMVAARQAGVAHTATEAAREYVAVRTAFGKPIGHFQAVAFNIADRHIDAESSKEMVRRAAWAWDSGQPEAMALKCTAQAIAHADEAAMRCADDCVQLHGGSGFIRELLAEKLMRDTKTMALCGLTAEQADQLATAVQVGSALKAELVLPTPESQAVFT